MAINRPIIKENIIQRTLLYLIWLTRKNKRRAMVEISRIEEYPIFLVFPRERSKDFCQQETRERTGIAIITLRAGSAKTIRSEGKPAIFLNQKKLRGVKIIKK